MMKLVGLFVGAALIASSASAARVTVDQKNNWDVFMKLYPKRALDAGMQGLVGFKLTLDRAGHPTSCEVTHSSGHKLLDDETCNVLLLHAEYQPPLDAEGNRVNKFATSGVINWRIPGRETGPTVATKVAAASPMEKKICKRTPVTGSNARFERICMTAREWDRNSVAAREELEEHRKTGWTNGR